MPIFLIWGWQTKTAQLGFVGPYSCPNCSWMGSFWLQVWERRFRLYFIPVTGWRAAQYGCVCRNCGATRYLRASEGAALLASAQPLGSSDPLGPSPTPASRGRPADLSPTISDPTTEDEGKDAAWQAFAERPRRG